MVTKKQLKEENEKLKTEIATLNVLLRAYMQSNHKLQDDIDVLNESLNCTAADRDRWRGIAHKADERRREYVRNHNDTDKADQ